LISCPIVFAVAGFILGPDGFLPHGPTPTFPDKAVICGAPIYG
jgi:hypothetical protein